MADYNWKPINRLSDDERKTDLAAMRPLYENWRASKKRLQETSEAQLAEFNRRLIRRLSVETGILERLYELDVGTTEALVANGFLEDLVSHSSTNIEPARLIDILRDQEAAVQLIVDCVAKNRELTKGLLHELHTILTRHQETTAAVDQFGNRLEIPLLRGKFKEQPNNPKRPDGSLHQYCPPIHVDSEVDNLLAWLPEYAKEDPIIVAAWLHHRFTQIHPYQDGNGRVARALTTLVLLRADLLPLVVDRDLRAEYIKALELADQAQLSTLAEIFARLERNAILQALSVDADAEISSQKSLTSAVIGSLADKFGKRRTQKVAELRQVNSVAVALRARAHLLLEKSFAEIEPTLSQVGEPTIYVRDGGPDSKTAHWYKYEVVQSAREAHRFANFAEDHYFVRGLIRVNTERLTFVVSFHHVGRDLTGIMEATAFSKLESYEDSEDRESLSERFSLCSVEPFVFTHRTDVNEIADAFGKWIDAALAVAVKDYGDRL
ncbi:MAG: Fic family protein [Bryobacterales bacterium]|nr:Fic family protein [Bryobacterales bacterium]